MSLHKGTKISFDIDSWQGVINLLATNHNYDERGMRKKHLACDWSRIGWLGDDAPYYSLPMSDSFNRNPSAEFPLCRPDLYRVIRN